MKLLTHSRAGQQRLAAVLGDRVIDLNWAYAALVGEQGGSNPAAVADATVPSEVLSFLRLGPSALDEARRALAHVESLDPDLARRDLLAFPQSDVRLLPPVPNPPKIICVARNYAEHAKEAGRELSEIPIVFGRFPVTLVASGDPVVRPTVSPELDWEGELAVVIGKSGRRVSRQDAMSHVAGYSVFNDVTVRDYQFRVAQYTAGKNFNASGPFGPYLVSTDEVVDPHALDITTKVNGEVKQAGNTSDMVFDVPTIIEHISEWIELEPGDVIATGTPAGVGFKRNPPEFLRPGDIVEVSITGLGTLRNPVIGEEELA